MDTTTAAAPATKAIFVVTDDYAGFSGLISESAIFPTVADAEAFLATLPKGTGIKASTLTSWDTGERTVRGTLWSRIDLQPNKATGAANEAGLKKIAKIIASGAFTIDDQRTK